MTRRTPAPVRARHPGQVAQHTAPERRRPPRGRVVSCLLLAAALAGCAFDPVYLDAEATLVGVEEVAGVVADGDGFALAGSRFDEDDEARTVVLLGASAVGAVTSAHPRPLDRAGGLLLLPGGDRFVYGHGSAVSALRIGRDGREVWGGPVGNGQQVRAALFVDGRVALAGGAHVPVDGGPSRTGFWFALLDPGAGATPVAEDVWLPPGAVDAYLRAIAPRPGGGFLLGGHTTTEADGDRPWLLAVGTDGRIERENLFLDADLSKGRVNALAAVGDRVVVAGEDGRTRGWLRWRGADGTWATPARLFCAGGVAPTRAVALVTLDDGLAAAGWRDWNTRDLWLGRFDAEGHARWLRTYGPLTAGGADRVSLARSAVGGFALAATRCADADCDGPGGEARFWHLDGEGGPFGAAETPECPRD